jgi:hypothetical protein
MKLKVPEEYQELFGKEEIELPDNSGKVAYATKGKETIVFKIIGETIKLNKTL